MCSTFSVRSTATSCVFNSLPQLSGQAGSEIEFETLKCQASNLTTLPVSFFSSSLSGTWKCLNSILCLFVIKKSHCISEKWLWLKESECAWREGSFLSICSQGMLFTRKELVKWPSNVFRMPALKNEVNKHFTVKKEEKKKSVIFQLKLTGLTTNLLAETRLQEPQRKALLYLSWQWVRLFIRTPPKTVLMLCAVPTFVHFYDLKPLHSGQFPARLSFCCDSQHERSVPLKGSAPTLLHMPNLVL